MWHFSCKNFIPCLHWFLPKSLLWNLQYSGMFSVTVESHCQGKQNQKFPWQCDQTLCGNQCLSQSAFSAMTDNRGWSNRITMNFFLNCAYERSLKSRQCRVLLNGLLILFFCQVSAQVATRMTALFSNKRVWERQSAYQNNKGIIGSLGAPRSS